MSEAILLLAHGTPDVLADMPEYLDKVTNGRPMPQHVVEELQHRYAEIGLRDTPLPEKPPLTRWTLQQAQLLHQRTGLPVYVGMRNWHPFIDDVVSQMKAEGVTRTRVLCLAPQNSRTSTGLYRKALDAALAAHGNPFTYEFTSGWANDPLLAEAFAQKLWPVWAEACAKVTAPEGKKVHIPILFTAHSVPCRTVLQNGQQNVSEGPPPAEGIQNYGPSTTPDPYPVECKKTAANVASLLSAVGLKERDWYFAFQSQGIAGAPWLGPTVEETLKALAEEGHRAVVLQPIGFLCDHVEILYDIDIAFKETAANLGIELTRPPSLNDSSLLIEALHHVLASANLS